jgi:hypothetical protein
MKRVLKIVLMVALAIGALGLMACVTPPYTPTLTADIKIVNNSSYWVDVYLDGVKKGYVDGHEIGYINYVYLGAHKLEAYHNTLSWGPKYFSLDYDGDLYTWTLSN